MDRKLGREEKKLIKQGLVAVRARGAFKRRLEADIQRNKARRSKVAAKFRRKLFAKAFQAAGIDQQEIKKRQIADDRSRELYLKKLLPKVAANVKDVRRRHAAQAKLLLSGFNKSLPPSGPMPPGPSGSVTPVDVQFLGVADSIDVSSDTGRSTTTRASNENNVLQTELIVNSGDAGGVNCDVSFLYMPPQSGSLKTWAFVAANGHFSWNSWPTCWDDFWIHVRAGASLSVQQFGADGTLVQLPTVDMAPDWVALGDVAHHYDQDDHCSGDFGIDVMDAFQVMELPGFLPTVGSRWVQIVVSLDIAASTNNGSGDLDFTSSGAGINVIGVAVQLF